MQRPLWGSPFARPLAPNRAVSAERVTLLHAPPLSLNSLFTVISKEPMGLFIYFRERHVKNVVDTTKSGHVSIKIRTMLMLVAGLVCIQAGGRTRAAPEIGNCRN